MTGSTTGTRGSWAAALAMALAPVLLAAGCGAIDDSAPLAKQPKHCKTLDEHLAPLDQHVAAGNMVHLGRIIREDLDRASLRAIVKLLLDTIAALPAGTFEDLAVHLNKPTAGDTLGPLLIALLEPLAGDPAATPPKPPKLPQLLAFSKIANACLSETLFAVVTDLLRDKRLEPVLRELLKGGSALGPRLEKALADAGVDGKAAIVALIRNIAVSLAAPGFDPAPLLAALDGIAGDNKTLLALRELLAIALLDDKGEVDKERVAAVSGFVRCFIDIDHHFVLPGYWYDVAAGGALSIALAATPDTAEAQEDRLQALLAVTGLLSYLTDALAKDPGARDALGQAGGLVLRPDLAVEAIPEVVQLLRTAVLDGLPSLLSDIATRPCLKHAPP